MNPSIKYLAMHRHKNKYSISIMCEFFEVSRSGYYGFVKRMNLPYKDKYLIKLIEEFNKNQNELVDTVGFTYGYNSNTALV